MSYCSICKASSTPGSSTAAWVCPDCVSAEAQSMREWISMVERFRSGRPRKGESFSVVRQVVQDGGAYYAVESIGSTYVSARLSIAERCEDESQARAVLGV